MNRRSFLKSLGGLSLVPVVGSTASIQAHDNKVMYNGQWWPKEGQNTDHDERYRFSDVNYRDAIRITEPEYRQIISNAVNDAFENKLVDALERRV